MTDPQNRHRRSNVPLDTKRLDINGEGLHRHISKQAEYWFQLHRLSTCNEKCCQKTNQTKKQEGGGDFAHVQTRSIFLPSASCVYG